MKKTLRITTAALIITALVSITSCTKNPIWVNYTFADMNISVQTSSYEIYQIYYFPISHNDITAALTSTGATDLSKVITAQLKSIRAVVLDSTKTFDQVGDIEVYFKTATAPQDSSQIAYSSNIAPGATSIDLSVDGTEMKQALTNDITITVKVLPKATGITALNLKLTGGALNVQVAQ